MKIINNIARVVALDLGERSIGVALSNHDNKYALEFFQFTYKHRNINEGIDKILTFINQQKIDKIIIGYPVSNHEEAKKSKIQNYIDIFSKILNQKLSNNIGIIFFDERYTTQEAIKKVNTWESIKDNKDALAAKIILDTYLSTLNIE